MRRTAAARGAGIPRLFARFRPFGAPSSLFAEADGTVWAPYSLQVMRFDSHHAQPMAPPPTPVMRRITVNRDRLLYRRPRDLI